MKEKKFSYDSEGNYHDDDVRLNNYTESADIQLERTDIVQKDFNQRVNPIFAEKVVQQVQQELGPILQTSTSPNEIKLIAYQRFMDLVGKGLLSQTEASECYSRFVHKVDFYYGT